VYEIYIESGNIERRIIYMINKKRKQHFSSFLIEIMIRIEIGFIPIPIINMFTCQKKRFFLLISFMLTFTQ
jgi:hypothetical protein